MVKLCCIPICPNSRAGRGVDCYPFPSADAALRGKWIDFVGANARKFRWKTKYICAEHFHQLELIEADDGRREPAEGAVPIVYSPDEDEEDDLMERDDVMVSGKSSDQSSQPEGSTAVRPLREIAELRSLFCRICLKKGDGLIPLNTKLHNENLLDIIYTIAGLAIENEEDLPTKVCASCVEKLDLAFNVRVEFLHCEEILRNLIKNKQLEVHYQSYDNHLINSRSWNGTYLNNLMDNVKQDITIEQPGVLLDSKVNATKSVKIEPVVVDSAGDELLEEMEEEHLYDEEELNCAEDISAEQEAEDVKNRSPQESRAKKLIVKIEPDSEEEQVSTTKYVYSWKELCKPKRIQQPKEYKISEELPEPDLVPHTCYVCDTVHEDADALENHIEEHVRLLPYTCDQCSTEEVPQVLKSLISLNKHLQTHQFPYPCDYCPLRYLSRRAYITHMRSVHEEADKDGYTCDDCGQHFARKRTFSVHLYKHKAIREGKYKCEHCGKAFSGPALLKRHLRIHTGEKPFECKKCGKRFNHESIFQVHKRTHIGEKAHVCSECGKKFIIATELRYHMADHFPDDPRYRTQKTASWVRYDGVVSDGSARSVRNATGPKERICEFENCGYVTTSAQKWHYHCATHARKFQCEICARRFPTNQTLVKHVEKAHEGKVAEKTRPCPYCQKMFSSNQKLQGHVDIHENNRRHKCRFCDKSFVQLANCIAHERIHTGERPYSCRACPSAFISSSGRKKHEKKHPELD
ncbi:zinc finger protein 676-like [Ochlerotatus camptorhynchus]|uniref:zinc finger protein 676-like n=1 Tax=Ochlerotatus camptorhynchus TaxID=644619 RepID=UPI0031CE3C61